MATRVTLRAGSASLHWHGSRHGQPSVIADVSKNMSPLRQLILISSLLFACPAFGEADPAFFATLKGSLGFPFGTYHTIEGWRCDTGKVGTRTLMVDTIDGKPLDKIIHIWIENISYPGLPGNERIVLKGYESGKFVGTPDLPTEENKKWEASQLTFQFRSYFVPTTIVSPHGLQYENPPQKNES